MHSSTCKVVAAVRVLDARVIWVPRAPPLAKVEHGVYELYIREPAAADTVISRHMTLFQAPSMRQRGGRPQLDNTTQVALTLALAHSLLHILLVDLDPARARTLLTDELCV
jgi:hypothetical protein